MYGREGYHTRMRAWCVATPVFLLCASAFFNPDFASGFEENGPHHAKSGVNSAIAEEILTWADCIKEAAGNNPDLISAREIITQSEAGRRIASSALFPQVTGELTAERAKGAAGGAASARKAAAGYSYGTRARQLLFDGFKTVNNVNAAKENIQASRQGYRFTSAAVRLRLRTAFVNLLRGQELIRVTEEIARMRKDSYELITLRYQSGLEHKGALLTAEANLAQAYFEAAQAQRDVEFAQRQLTKEMGREEFRSMFVRADFKVSDPVKEKPDFEALVNNSPALLRAIAQKNAAEFGVKSAYADFLPVFSGQAGASKAGSRWAPQNDQWNAGFVISLPIFEGGLRFAQVSQAAALANQLQSDERSARDGIIVNLAQTWAALRDAVETVDVRYKILAAAQERAKIAEAQYSTGFIAYDNWTIIQDNLVRAKREFLDARAHTLLAEAQWIQAKGETLEYAR